MSSSRSALLGVALLLVAGGARAEPTAGVGGARTEARIFSARAAAGIGPGVYGPGLRWGLSGEGWLTERLGVGAFFGASGQGTACVLCASQNEEVRFFGPTFAARTSRRGPFGLATLGLGYARGEYSETNGLFSSSPTLPQVLHHGGVLSLTGLLAARVGPLEGGPGLTLDVTTWGTVLVTLNLALGFAVP